MNITTAFQYISYINTWILKNNTNKNKYQISLIYTIIKVPFRSMLHSNPFHMTIFIGTMLGTRYEDRPLRSC